jgi:CcmD family protein
MHYLYAAFIATWVIHGLYLASLSRGYARVKEEIKELEQK